MEDQFFKIDYGNEVYAVSYPLWYPTAQTGGAVMQTWVVVGEERAMAIDSPVPAIEGFKKYLEDEFKRPIMMINSHGHIDHTGCNGQFDEVWLNERDWPLLLGGGIKPLEDPITTEGLAYRLNPLKDCEEIDLGNRRLLAIPIKGHTLGSMMIYDEQSKGLFSGDSVARRILYGLSGWTPVSEYMEALSYLRKFEIEKIYSMHDAFALPGNLPQNIIKNIVENLPTIEQSWTMPEDGQEFLRILLGENEADPLFFDFVIPSAKKEEALEDLKEQGFLNT